MKRGCQVFARWEFFIQNSSKHFTDFGFTALPLTCLVEGTTDAGFERYSLDVLTECHHLLSDEECV